MKGILRQAKIKLLVLIGKAIDIHSKGKWPSNELSNFYPHSFIIDGIQCSSMEGFLQSLKATDFEKQINICLLTGKDAKAESSNDWKKQQMLFWRGKTYHRNSKDFQDLLRRAYNEMKKQNISFTEALKATGKKKIYHSIGNPTQSDTILTEKNSAIS